MCWVRARLGTQCCLWPSADQQQCLLVFPAVCPSAPHTAHSSLRAPAQSRCVHCDGEPRPRIWNVHQNLRGISTIIGGGGWGGWWSPCYWWRFLVQRGRGRFQLPVSWCIDIFFFACQALNIKWNYWWGLCWQNRWCGETASRRVLSSYWAIFHVSFTGYLWLVQIFFNSSFALNYITQHRQTSRLLLPDWLPCNLSGELRCTFLLSPLILLKKNHWADICDFFQIYSVEVSGCL